MKSIVAFIAAVCLRSMAFFLLEGSLSIAFQYNEPLPESVFILLIGAAIFWTAVSSVEKGI